MAEDLISDHGHRRSWRRPAAVGGGGQFQPRIEGRRRVSRRPRQQGRVPGDLRPLAQAAAQDRQGSVRQDMPSERDQQEGAGRDAGRRRHRGLRGGAQRDRGVRPGAGLCDRGASSRPRPGPRPSASWSAAASATAGSANSPSRAPRSSSSPRSSRSTWCRSAFIRMRPALIGALHLAPSWIFEAYDSILAVDIGGTNIRCGVVETRWKKAPDLSKAEVWKSRAVAACRRRADARRRGEAAGEDAEGTDRARPRAKGSSSRRSSASPAPA